MVSALDSSEEAAGVLAVRAIDDDEGCTLLGRRLDWAPSSAYLERDAHQLKLQSTGWVPAARAAGNDNSLGLFIHTHPNGTAQFSVNDDVVDAALAYPFMRATGADIYGSLVIAGSPQSPSIAGRLFRPDGDFQPVDVVRIVGERLDIRSSLTTIDSSDVYERQIRALGSAGQAMIGTLRVGVVGAGGTGSAVTEQLIRLGVGEIYVVDDDVITSSNISRCYGSTVDDIGRPKVEVLADLASRIGSGCVVHPVQGNIRSQATAKRLRHCDVVFSCVDGHGARLVLNRFASWHLAPVIDLAVLVSSENDRVTSIDGRVTWLAPGTACLLCRGRIDPTLAYAEQLDPEERRSLAEQGYAPALEEPQPSVVTYTSLVASFATSELLARVFGLSKTDGSEMIIQITDRNLRNNRRPGRVDCFCQDRSMWGAGVAGPYLDVTWAQ